MREKNKLEYWAVVEFARLFSSSACRGELKFIELLDPPSPDVFCELSGSGVYLEVTHVYGTESDVRTALGREGKVAADPVKRKQDAFIHFGSRVIGPLNFALEKKARKKYDREPVWLLIRSGFPLMDLEDFERYKDDIIVPKCHGFEEIWLLCGKTASSGALQLA